MNNIAGGVPNIYRTGGGHLANYDAIDLLEGVGIVKFYGGGLAISGGTVQYRLDRKTFNCSVTVGDASPGPTTQKTTQVSATSTTYAKLIDYDFDSAEINLPVVLDGTMITNIPISMTISNDAGTEPIAYVVMTLKRLGTNGTTETDIVSTTSEDVQVSNAPMADQYFAFQSAVPTTVFKKGEKIRITVELWGKRAAGAGTCYFRIGHDPQGGAVTAVANSVAGFAAGFTEMEFYLPFKIDL